MSSLFPLNSIFDLYGDDLPARRRRNHCMVEEGFHVVPTLRNRVVIFYYYQHVQLNPHLIILETYEYLQILLHLILVI